MGYLSLEIRFSQLQTVAATDPGCLKAMTTHLMGMERGDGVKKAVM